MMNKMNNKRFISANTIPCIETIPSIETIQAPLTVSFVFKVTPPTKAEENENNALTQSVATRKSNASSLGKSLKQYPVSTFKNLGHEVIRTEDRSEAREARLRRFEAGLSSESSPSSCDSLPPGMISTASWEQNYAEEEKSLGWHYDMCPVGFPETKPKTGYRWTFTQAETEAQSEVIESMYELMLVSGFDRCCIGGGKHTDEIFEDDETVMFLWNVEETFKNGKMRYDWSLEANRFDLEIGQWVFYGPPKKEE